MKRKKGEMDQYIYIDIYISTGRDRILKQELHVLFGLAVTRSSTRTTSRGLRPVLYIHVTRQISTQLTGDLYSVRSS